MALGQGAVVLVFLVISGAVRQPLNSLLLLLLMDTKGIGSARIGAAGGLFFAISEIGGFGGPFIVGVLRDITGDAQLGIIVIGLVMLVLTPLTFKVTDYKYETMFSLAYHRTIATVFSGGEKQLPVICLAYQKERR